MVRCHECNSQVAENDLFCPFCGVMLRMPGSDAPVEDVSANATTEPSLTDIPVPAILADYGRTADNVTPPPTSEYSIDDSAEPTAESEATPVEEEEKTNEMEEVVELKAEAAEASGEKAAFTACPYSISVKVVVATFTVNMPEAAPSPLMVS